jgi:lysozyme
MIMRIILNESQLLRIIKEQEGSSPKNPDVYPDQDEWGGDDAWNWDEWKIYYDSLVKKYGQISAKKRFLKYWEVVEEGVGVLADNDMEPQWFKDKNMWNEDEDRPYFITEYENSFIKGKKTDGTTLKVGQKFWEHIKYEEGSAKDKSKPMLIAYKDSGGVLTIGWGHTGNVIPGQTITEKQALDLLYEDAKESADCVRRFLNNWKNNKELTKKGVPSWEVTQGQFDSMVSMVFNVGCQGFLNSDVAQLIKQGDHEKVIQKIKTFKIGKGEGLSARRESEINLYMN